MNDLDQSVVEVRADLNSSQSEEGSYHYHALHEDPGGCRSAEGKGCELVVSLVYNKHENSPVAMKDKNVKVSVLKLESGVPVPWNQKGNNGGHVKPQFLEIFVEMT